MAISSATGSRTQARPFQVFVKPGGATCNLECRYCYYLDKQHLAAAGEPARMPEDLLEEYIAQHIAASPDPVVTFSWHGGEPTVLGLDYFRRVTELQRKHRPAGRRIANGMQTNGLLLDESWCRFFAEESFSVGLSLDGPAELHDRYRVNRGQQPTHAQVMRAFDLLGKHRVACDILCVVHDQNVRHPARVYGFLRKIGARYIGFLPVVERRPGAPGGVSQESVSAGAYGTFLCAIFDEWEQRDVGQVTVQIIEEATRPARAMEHSLCIYRETCGDVPILERNGDLYSCDHFVDASHRLGNIRQRALAEMLESPAQVAFGQAKRNTLPRYCQACEVRAMCNGGCPKDRFIPTPDGEAGLNYLCAGLKRFFLHIRPYAERVAAEQRATRTLEALVPSEPAAAATTDSVGRNDPCPCGSGLKYKKCCLGKSAGWKAIPDPRA